MTRESVYLDWNATTPLAGHVRAAMAAAEDVAWANPASIHGPGRRARALLEAARETLARAVAVHPRDVVFTGGATEANHLALSGATSIVTSALEHPSILRQTEFLAAQGRPARFLRACPDGTVDLTSLREALGSLEADGMLGARPLVAVLAVSHETGVLQPLREVRGVVDDFGAELHVDAVQLLGRGASEVLEHADSITLGAHKICGPKGIGALAVRCGRTPRPLGLGGAQERGLRPGTQDARLAHGFAVALTGLDELLGGFQRAQALRDRLEEWVTARGGVIHGSAARLGHVSNFRLPGWKGDELVAALDLEGIAVSAGSACAAGTQELSPALLAMLGQEAAEGAVRVSFGARSEPGDLERLLGALERLTARAPGPVGSPTT